jgi:hypothetical protein
MPESKIIILTDILETRLRKEQELEFYQQELEKLQQKMLFLRKEIDLTNLIIDIIEKEKVADVRQGLLEDKEKEK